MRFAKRLICAAALVACLGLFAQDAMAQFAQDGMAQNPENRRVKPTENTIAPLGNVGASPRACTQMWCMEGYHLQINAASWAPGYYNFKIIADENVYSCEGSLPLPACGMPAVVCNDKAVSVMESGCAMAPATHSFPGIMLTHIPDDIVVSVTGPQGAFTHEGKVKKQCGYPNGEACDPRACCSANESVNVNW